VKRHAPWFLLLAAFTFGIICVRAFGDRFELPALVQRLRELGATAGALWLFAGFYVVGTSFLVPAVVFHVAAGAAFGFERALVLNFVLANVVSNLHFGLGRVAGKARVTEWLARRGWGGVTARLEREGVLAMATLRQVPLPFVGVNVAAGASPIRWRDFALGSGLGLVPQVGVYTWFAAAIANGVEGAKTETMLTAIAAGVALVVVLAAGRWLARRGSPARSP
jgi:uncharacterized membrane protein YdjX (TVP38/TMEM64 family)